VRRPRGDDLLLGTLLAAQIAIVVALPVLVGHDLPQHLAQARLLGDADDGHLAPPYEGPLAPDPYFTTYRVLGLLAAPSSIEASARLVYALYAVAFALAFRRLARAADETPLSGVHYGAALGPILVWNPITCMGFLPFMLALPCAFAATALVLDGARRLTAPRLVALLVLGVATASFHAAAAGVAALIALVIALTRRKIGTFVAATTFVATMLLTLRALRQGTGPTVDFAAWRANVATWGFVDGTVGTFVLSFAPIEMKAKLVLATVLGPFPRQGKVLVFLLVAAAVAVVAFARRPVRTALPRSRLALGVAAFVVLLVAVFGPTAIQVPDDMCLIDFRLYVIAFALAVALVPRRAFHALRARIAVVVASFGIVAIWGGALYGAAREAEPATELVRTLAPQDRLLALSFHDRSAWFDEDNSMLHDLPVYFTARTAGTTTLFWGRFDRHLPVGYRPGGEPHHPPPYSPDLWTEEDLGAATHVLVALPDADDDEQLRAGAARLIRSGAVQPLACGGRFCLFGVASRQPPTFSLTVRPSSAQPVSNR
jgi:hypothetical protein